MENIENVDVASGSAIEVIRLMESNNLYLNAIFSILMIGICILFIYLMYKFLRIFF